MGGGGFVGGQFRHTCVCGCVHVWEDPIPDGRPLGSAGQMAIGFPSLVVAGSL